MPNSAPPAYTSYPAGTVVGTKLYLFGGYDRADINNAQVFDAATGSWSALAPMPQPARSTPAVALNGIIYVVGGTPEGLTQYATVQAYDIASNTWSLKATMPTPLMGPAAATLNGLIYVFGGQPLNSLSSTSDAVQVFDPVHNSWSLTPPTMPAGTGAVGAAAVAVGGTIYVAGGRIVSTYPTAMLAFTPDSATSTATPTTTPIPTATVAAPQPTTVWINALNYGSAGGGFYWDFTSGMVWTAERGWHSYSPQSPSPTSTLWVNYLGYGSAGGGFYLDPLSGLVWTAERGWHAFSPQPAAIPAPNPNPVVFAPANPPDAVEARTTPGSVSVSNAERFRSRCVRTGHNESVRRLRPIPLPA